MFIWITDTCLDQQYRKTYNYYWGLYILTKDTSTHWGRVTHICVGKNAIIIASDNVLSPGRRQAIIWANAGILSTGPLGTNFSEIWIGIQIFALKQIWPKIPLKVSSAKWRLFCIGLNALRALSFDHNHLVPVGTNSIWTQGTYHRPTFELVPQKSYLHRDLHWNATCW